MVKEKSEKPKTKSKSGGHTVTNENRKKYGFNMAKVMNQKGK